MPMVSNIKLGAKINALIKGEPGVGKTFIEGSFPKPMYIFDLDQKVDVIKKMELVLGEEEYSSKGIEYDTYSAAEYESFANKLDSFERMAQSGSFPYKTVCVDSLTTLAIILIRYSLSKRGAQREEEGNKKEGRKRGIILMPEFEEFNLESLAINAMLDIGRNLPCHFLMSAHVIKTESKSQNRIIETRSLMTAGKKIAAAIPAQFKEQWHVEIDTGLGAGDNANYLVRTRGTGNDFASTLLPLPSTIDFTNKSFYPILKDLLLQKGIELDHKAKEISEEDAKTFDETSTS